MLKLLFLSGNLHLTFSGFVNRVELNHTEALSAKEMGNSNVGEEQLGSEGGSSSAQTGLGSNASLYFVQF